MARELDRDFGRVVPGGVFVAGAGGYPDDLIPVADSGKGPYLRSTDGREFVDYVLGGGPMLVGHAHPHVVDAVTEQIEQGATFYVPSDVGYDLAERIVGAVPSADSIKFTSTGGEATYLALRLARAYTDREKVLKFAGAYHGCHDYAMRSSSYANVDELRATEYPDGTTDSAGVVAAAAESVLVAPYNDLDATTAIVRDKADELAAIIVEPVMRSLPPVEGFLSGLRQLCDEHEIVLIFDEVVTGFRWGWGGAQERYGVTPDLTTLGKAIGGGTPVAAVSGRGDIMHLSDPGVSKEDGGVYFSGTLNGNPLCAAAGMATLDVLSRDGTYEKLFSYGDSLRGLIADLLADSSRSGVPMGEGPVVDFLITEESEVTRWEQVVAADSETKRDLDTALLERGILQLHGAKRYVSTEHGEEEFGRTAEAYKQAFEQVL